MARSEHGKVNPVIVLVGVAVVAFVAALLVARGGSKGSDDVATGDRTVDTSTQGSGCDTSARADSSYSVAMVSDPSPPKVEGTVFHLAVKHGGAAVKGATVCVSADMTEMHHEGINNTAKEGSAGTYDTALRFSMRGPYAATVVIAEKGKDPVSVPVTFDVE